MPDAPTPHAPSQPPQPSVEEAPLWQRLGWMVAIWVMSVAVLGAVAWALRLWIAPAG